MARIRYNPSAKRRGFRTQQLSTAGIDRMREESNRLVQGMRSRHQAEDAQRERERRAMEADQAYQERITRENNAIEQRNLQIEAEREIGGINAKIKQRNIDTQATMSILSSIASFSQTANKYIAQKQAEDIKNTPVEPYPLEERRKAQRLESTGGVILDANNVEDSIKSNEDPRLSLKPIVTNPARLNRNQRRLEDKKFRASAPEYIRAGFKREFTAANGKTFTGLEIENSPELVNEFYNQLEAEMVAMSGMDRSDLPETMQYLQAKRRAGKESALNAAFQQDKAILVSQTDTLLRTGDADDIALGYSGGKSLGNAKLLQMMSTAIADPYLSDEKREALLNFVIPMKGNKKPFRESHYDSQVGPALAELRTNQTKITNAQIAAQKAESDNWVLQNIDTIQSVIDDTPRNSDLEEREVELRRGHQAKFPNVPFPQELANRFATKKRGNLVDIRNSTDEKFRNKELDLPYVNSIEDAKERKYANGKFQQQQVDLYGEGYKPFMANIDSLAKKEADFTSTIAGDTNGKVEALKAKMLDFAKNHELYSLSITQDANATHKAMLEYLRTAAITDGSNGDPLNPFRYKEGDHGREYLEFGVPDPDKKQHLNWFRKKATSSKSLGELIYNNPYLIPADEISKVPKAQELGLPIVFNDVVYVGAKLYNVKPTEFYNAVVKRRNEVAGTNDPYVTPNDFTELQDNASPEWNKLISSGNYDQVRRAGAQVNGQLPMRTSMSGGIRGLANLVSSGEGSPDSMFPGENYPEMLGMTIGEVVEFQKQKLAEPLPSGKYRESAAVGDYQFLYPEVAAQRAGLSINDKFTPENQLKMFMGTLLNKPGRENVSAFLQGTGNDIETAIDELSQEFASIEYRDGRSYYDDGVNKASISRDQVRAALLSAREEFTTQ
jgi:hypothetical protein|tara:strand:- start:69 stop:2762 length:2694 start_codon:yes stop_codon:yes gene_type:complete